MSIKARLYELQEQKRKITSECDYLQAVYNTEKYRENEDLIGTAWVNKTTNEYYFVLDYNPCNIYSCYALHFKNQDLTGEILHKNELINRIDFINLSFPPIDFSDIACETVPILISNIIKNEKISTDEFVKQLNCYTLKLITQLPILCKERHEKEIEEVMKKGG